MGEFLAELWAFMKERKKFWLMPITRGVAAAWDADRSHARVCGCAVHLHAVLGRMRKKPASGVLDRSGLVPKVLCAALQAFCASCMRPASFQAVIISLNGQNKFPADCNRESQGAVSASASTCESLGHGKVPPLP